MRHWLSAIKTTTIIHFDLNLNTTVDLNVVFNSRIAMSEILAVCNIGKCNWADGGAK